MMEQFDFEHLIRETLESQRLNIKVSDFRKEPKVNSDFSADAEMKIAGESVLIEVKRSIEPQNLKWLTERYLPNERPVLIVAEYISPKAKELLIESGFNYLDKAGNIFLNLPGIRIKDEGHKNSPISESYRNRAFTKAGISVVFQLLMDPQAVNDTQRSLSHKAGVSLGTIPKVLEQLKNEAYIMQADPVQKVLVNYEDLLKRWISAAREKLFDANEESRYQPLGRTNNELFRNEAFNGDAYWGGEPGAALLTSYLKPEKFVLYTSLSNRELLKKYKLQKTPTGELHVRQPFWAYALNTSNHVHPILIYAELVSSGDSRNLETAELIFDEYIKQNI